MNSAAIQIQSFTSDATSRTHDNALALPHAGESLHRIARSFLEKHEGDATQAAIEMQEALAEPELRRALTEDAIAIAVRAKLAAVRTYERSAIERDVKSQSDVIMRRAGSIDRALMNFPLPFGGRLRDAKKAEIIVAASHYEVSAATQQRRALWLRKVAEKLDGYQTVSSQLTEADLISAWSGQ